MIVSPSEMKIGIVVARNDSGADVMNIAAEVYSPLLRRGCSETNIQLKYVPCDLDLVLGVVFFAEYTDVDGVIAVGRRYDSAIASSLLDLQVEWNMPIEYRYEGSYADDGCNLVEMIRLQDEMAADTPEERTPATRRESIN